MNITGENLFGIVWGLNNREMKTAIIVFQILFFATVLVFSGYEFGLYQAGKEEKSKIINDHFWEYEGRPQVYSDNFMKLTEAERDSFRLDAIEKLR